MDKKNIKCEYEYFAIDMFDFSVYFLCVSGAMMTSNPTLDQ